MNRHTPRLPLSSTTGTRLRSWLLAIAATTVLTACAQHTLPDQAQADARPVVLVPPDFGSPMSATVAPLQPHGFVETERFIEGQASRYRITDPLHDAQRIDIANPYVTRVLVRRPVDPARFNGTVVVEWLNVTLDQDVDFVYGATRELLLREGYAWIGVSAQHHGIDAMKQWNPQRYSQLDVTASNRDPRDGSLIDPPNPLIMAKGGDVLAWDIFSQVGRLAKSSNADLLGPLQVKRVIAAAESQSTLKMTTYYNSIQPLHQIYDGFLFYDRSGTLRTDVKAKSIAIGTEIFTALMKQAPQPDTDHQRWWEINGASHFSLDEIAGYVDPMIQRDAVFHDAQGHALSLSARTAQNGPCTPASIYSRVPNGDVMKAALKALNSWIQGGPAPATAPRFVMDAQTPSQYVRDSEGHVQGGIRTAAQVAPMAQNAGIGQGPWFCGPSGHHIDFTPARLCQRYGSHDAYVNQVKAAVTANVKAGFILPEEAASTIAQAQAQTFSCSTH